MEELPGCLYHLYHLRRVDRAELVRGLLYFPVALVRMLHVFAVVPATDWVRQQPRRLRRSPLWTLPEAMARSWRRAVRGR